MEDLTHGYRVIIKFNDGTEDIIFEYSKEKVADSVIRQYKKQTFVASVKKEEF